MNIPAYFILGIFALVVLSMTAMIGAQLYHGYRFGRNDPVTMTVNTIFLLAIISVLSFTALFLSPIDWTQTINLSRPTFNLPGGDSLQFPSSPSDIPSISTTP